MPASEPTRKPVWVDTELLDHLQRLKDKDGVPMAESVRRAIKAYLTARGELDSPRPPQLDVHA